MEIVSESILDRMPEDLCRYLENLDAVPNVPVCEANPAEVAFEVIPAGTTQIKAYFPASAKGNTVVFVHFPRGRTNDPTLRRY